MRVNSLADAAAFLNLLLVANWGPPRFGNPVTVTNQLTNFGWEYVWHCHLLGHEENDMMRAMAVAVPPQAPSNLAATVPATGTLRVVLTWTSNDPTATAFKVQRATNAAFTANVVTFNVAKVAGPTQTYTDSTVAANTTYYYRVLASNIVGSTITGYPTTSADSAPSNSVVVGPPAAPSGVTVSQPGTAPNGPVVISWTDNAPTLPNPPNYNAETAFTVQRATNSAFTSGLTTLTTVAPAVAGTGGTGTWADITTQRRRTYYYRVAATNRMGSSAWAVGNSITTRDPKGLPPSPSDDDLPVPIDIPGISQ